MGTTDATMMITNGLLVVVSILLSIIGFLMAKFYSRFEKLADDFHKATIQIATHETRLDHLEQVDR